MRTAIIGLTLMLGLSGSALAHDTGSHGKHGGHHHAEAGAGGEPGKATDVERTITIVATDSAFEPKAISVKAGETIRFVVRNDGKLVHELTIGTAAIQAEHQSEMLGFSVSGALQTDRFDQAKLSGHSHGNNVLLAPGKTGEIIWKFAKAADLEFGCNVPGHYEQGMKGEFKVD